ncbi:hypothetical protein O6H91_11G032400 [Diphasiastrum complanatum]|uniref:Uncharacterized protein n=10 Tax=Diphasiastrum complanatum TaxID=34168 RepID=A0ACC2C7L5_DIPCM|nr:hypothetical protein O6H91_11G032400 [Diphasiastrum complanatum]KAJ7538042.1 hypothetical protein O6H91_11G032400 [Diphasiastrum complanatum]KAJ7538043.1 hypothetical protein O6H91_11G032400 [Diphasiastrum complanatum]KAJ7538044.1 hypothetical protein O6H91_11G032400 [Diphasiastrum complanatum]KAJ7538045.1 hypothetical protein O6H91_11G032400 [Diphasiastrum complanatum]
MATAKQFLPLRRVVVTGLGLVTPLANGVETTWQRLLDKKSGIRELRSEDLKLNGVEDAVRVETLKQLSSKVVATVPIGTGVADFNMEKYSHGKEKYVAPFIAYALCAAEEALSDANWQPEDEEAREKTGVAIGGGIGCINDVTQAAQLLIDKRVRRISPFFIPRILINMAAGHISIKYGFKGPNHAAVTACASGAHSVGDASRMIKFGDADVMVAGGTEASIDALSIAGFCRARALSTKYNDDPQKSSRPFDCGRDGFVIGEGAGVMVLEEYEHAKKRGARIYAELCGYGLSGDAYHITQPSHDGRGAVLAMTRALQQSGLRPDEVDYVNAHATSTLLGDAVEAGAIKSVFKKHALSGNLSLSSTKGATGHLLGAAGAVEAIFTILALHHGEAPPTLNLDKPDPVFEEAFFPISCPRKMSVRAALTNSFGFGGTNASLLFASPS